MARIYGERAAEERKRIERIRDAAPELLAALKALLDDCPYVQMEDGCECGDGGTLDCVHMQAIAAIEKAEQA